MATPDTAQLLGLGVAYACGLLIGTERERRKGNGRPRQFAGMRSFALTALIGALCQLVGAGLAWVGASFIAALCLLSHWRERSDDPGVTTEMALFLSFLIGIAAMSDPALSAGAAVLVAATLKLGGPLHRFARVTLRTGELRDALILAGAVLVVRPLLPDSSEAWLLGFNPKTLWTLIVLILSIQGGAHIALRMAGPKLGMAMSGLASGFVSSVATTATMGGKCRNNAPLRSACVAGALLSNIATLTLLWIVAWTVAPGAIAMLAPTFLCASLAAVAMSGLALVGARRAPAYRPGRGRAFHIGQAATFALVLSLAGTAMAYANAHLGPDALLAGAALAGFFDFHAAAASTLSVFASGKSTPDMALLAVLLGFTSNTGSKALAALSGGWAFALRIHAALLVILAAAWSPFLWGMLVRH